ncbi:MAG: response regulator [Deltaproteobacteria bacterium]|nr:response regulator [Deltaproteobacteria bacterium]
MSQSTLAELTRLLVVHADEAERLTIRRYLDEAGVRAAIDELGDGQELASRAQGETYDCIILDHAVPGETAIDVLARLRASGVTTPILCVAGLDEELGAALVEAGATDFVPRLDLSPAKLARRLIYIQRLSRAERGARRIQRELEAQRQLLGAVIAQLPTAVAVVNPASHEILFANERALALFARGSLGATPTIEAAAPTAHRALVEAMATRALVRVEELWPCDGRAYRASAAPVLEADGAIVAGVVSLDDVTEMIQARDEAQREARAREMMLAIVSHDLRGPLNAIRVALDALGDDAVAGDERQRTVAMVERSVGRAGRLLDDLLLAHQIEVGTLRVAPVLGSIAAVLQQAARDHELMATRAGVELVVTVAPDVAPIPIDRDRMAQVLDNLIANALRHGVGSKRLELGARRDGEGVAVTVRDHGPGIPPDELGKIFMQDWQGRRARHGGAGLGLAIVRGIARAHGGEVAADNAPGGGAVFTVRLPAGS